MSITYGSRDKRFKPPWLHPDLVALPDVFVPAGSRRSATVPPSTLSDEGIAVRLLLVRTAYCGRTSP
jgi:hypothetical protein